MHRCSKRTPPRPRPVNPAHPAILSLAPRPSQLASRRAIVPADQGRDAPWLSARATQHRILGTRIPRVDGPEKVTGQARFGDDLALYGLLHVRLVLGQSRPRQDHQDRRRRSPETARRPRRHHRRRPRLHPKSPPTSRAREMLARGETRFCGQPVAAVVAETEAAAEDAVRAGRGRVRGAARRPRSPRRPPARCPGRLARRRPRRQSRRRRRRRSRPPLPQPRRPRRLRPRRRRGRLRRGRRRRRAIVPDLRSSIRATSSPTPPPP